MPRPWPTRGGATAHAQALATQRGSCSTRSDGTRPWAAPVPTTLGWMPAPPVRPIAYAGEPGAFAEDAVLAAFGDVARTPVGSFRAVFERSPAATSRRRRADRERHPRHGPRELRPADRVRPRRSRARSSSRSGCASRRCPASGSRTSSGCTRTSRRSARPRCSCGRDRGSCCRPTTRPGRARPSSTRAERGAAAVLSPRAAALFGLEVLADGIGDLPDNRTRFVVLVRPGRAAAPARSTARLPRERRSSSRSATSRAPCSPSSGSSPTTASTCASSSRARAASGPGSTSSGSTSTVTRPIRRWPPRSTRSAAVTTMTRVLGSYPSADALGSPRACQPRALHAAPGIKRPAVAGGPLMRPSTGSDRAGAGLALGGVDRVRFLAERAGLHLRLRLGLLDEHLRDLPDHERDRRGTR